MKFPIASFITFIVGAVSMSSAEESNNEVPSSCFDYSDIIPLNPREKCTGRSVFLAVRKRFLENNKSPDFEKCRHSLATEIMAVTETTSTEDAHTAFDELCEANMELYNSVPPPICYDYTDVLNVGPKDCTGRKIFLHIRELYMAQRDAPGAKVCPSGLQGELKGLTQTIDEDDAHAKLQELCDAALAMASSEAPTSSWKFLEDEPHGNIDLDEFFEGGGFLNEETGNFQQEENDFLKRGGYERYNYIGDDPRLNDHYRTTDQSYYGGKAIYKFHEKESTYTFLSSPTSAFEEGSCSQTNAAVCCWHRDRQFFDNNGNCNSADCANAEPGDNTDLCWTEKGTDGDIFPYPEDVTEGDLHCHGLAWAQTELTSDDINAKAKHNNLFFVSLYDHLYQRGYADSVTDDRNIAGYQAMCGCVEDMNPIARADCTEAVGRANYTAYQDGEGGPLVVERVPDTFYLEFRACEGYDYVEGFTPDDLIDSKDELTNSNNDLSAFIFRQYIEGKIDQDHVDVVKDTLIGYTDPSVNDGDREREIACKAAFEEKFPDMEWKEREIEQEEAVAL